MQVPFYNKPRPDGCFHLDDADVTPLARESGTIGEGTSGLGVEFCDVPVVTGIEVVGVERLDLTGNVLCGVKRRDCLENRSGEEIVPSTATIGLAIGEELGELVARGAEVVVLDMSDPFTAVTTLEGAHNPFSC